MSWVSRQEQMRRRDMEPDREPNVMFRHRPPSPPTTPVIAGRGPLERFEEWIGTDRLVRGVQFISRDCVTYPSRVFAHQCQVYPYNTVSALYAAPWQSLAVMHNITQSQGIRSWWRGWQTHALLQLGQPVVGAILERVTQDNRKERSAVSRVITNLLFNGLTYSLCMPLLSFSLMESVQNTLLRTYSSDYDGFKEYLSERPLVYPDPSKRLSFLQLLLPTLLLGFTRSSAAQLTDGALQRVVQEHPHPSSSSSSSSSLRHVLYRLTAVYAGSFLCDTLLYPFETVVVRLHCQGVPVLVDNVDTGLGVQYITSYHSGLIDCVRGVWDVEGLVGFFKGFSSLLLQYALQGMVLFLLWRALTYYENRTRQTHVQLLHQ